MTYVYLGAVGDVEAGLLETVQERISQLFALDVRRLPAFPYPEYAYDAGRKQYGSIPIMRRLAGLCPSDVLKLFALTECDLFIPMLSFIYGQAQLGGTIGIVSLARLRQEFYGLPRNHSVLAKRLRKEVTHELGHMFGLVHCPDISCAMALSTNVRQLDLKTTDLCTSCETLLREHIDRSSGSAGLAGTGHNKR